MPYNLAKNIFTSFITGMDTVKNCPVCFGAKFIKNANIKKYNSKSRLYNDAKVSFVEFEPENKADITAIISALREWKGEPFAGDIAQNLLYIAKGILSSVTNHIYLLTAQQSNLDKIKSGKILGMAYLFQEQGTNELKFLQVHPRLKHGVSQKSYKNIGTGIINSLKDLYKDSIELESFFQTTEFYEKQGFKPLGELRYRWEG